MKTREHLSNFFQAHWLFVFIASFFGIAFVFIVPPLWGMDETSHFARVYQISEGDLIPDRNKETFGGPIPLNLLELINYTKQDLLDNASSSSGARKDVTDTNGYDAYLNAKFSKSEQPYIWSASYSPVAYIGPLVGTYVAKIFNLSIGQTLLIARLGGLLFYILLVATSLLLLRDSKLKWVIFAIALFPAIIFLSSVVSADNVAIALSLLFAALFIRLQAKKIDKVVFRKLFFGIVIVSILLPLVKVNYIFISLGVLFVPHRHFKTKMHEVVIKSITATAGIGFAFLWSVIAKVTNDSPVTQRPDGVSISSSEQLVHVIHDPVGFVGAIFKTIALNSDAYIQSSTTLMGWNWVGIPGIFMILLIFSVFLALMYAKKEIKIVYPKMTIVWLSFFVACGVLSIFLALYLAFNPVGNTTVDGIQGRYFIPLAVPILILVTYFMPFELKVDSKTVRYLFPVISTICLIVAVMYYYTSLY